MKVRKTFLEKGLMSWTLKERYDFSQTRTDPCICFFIHSLNNHFLKCMPHDSLCYSYGIYQHLSYASCEKQPLTSKGYPCAMSRPWCSPVEHKQPQRTLTSDEATLGPWWASPTQDQITLNHIWIPTKTQTLSNHKNDQTSAYLG